MSDQNVLIPISNQITFLRLVGCEPPQLVVPQPEMIDLKVNVLLQICFLIQFSLLAPHPISRVLGPCWPAGWEDVAE